MKLRIVAIGALILFSSNSLLGQAPWEVPADQAAKVSSHKFDADFQAKGQAMFDTKCATCHGALGAGAAQPFVGENGDVATSRFQDQTDGALMYKIKAGRGAMPSFKDQHSEEELWQIIAYIRSSNPSYVQPEIVEVTSEEGETVSIEMELTENKMIKAFIFKQTPEGKQPMAGASLSVYAERYFGDQKIGEDAVTNAEGIALFAPDTSLAGNAEGKIVAKVKLNSLDLTVEASDTLALGYSVEPKSAVEGRHLWRDMKGIPIWLLLTYLGVTGGVWFFLIRIVLGLRKIKES